MSPQKDLELVIEQLEQAWKAVKRHPHKDTKGVDGISINSFAPTAYKRLAVLEKKLKEGSFSFNKLRPATLKLKGKKPREILVNTIDDRIVSKAILLAVQSRFQKYISKSDYAVSRPGNERGLNGIPLAAKHIQGAIKGGFVWVVEADIQKFFDKVPKNKILNLIKKEIPEKKLFGLVKEIVHFNVDQVNFDSDKDYSESVGVAQGSSLSPLLASIYLSTFDEFFSKNKEVVLVRYVDDFVILCKTEIEAGEALKNASSILKKLDLSIHEKDVPDAKGKIKTRIVPTGSDNFVFLGLNFNGTSIDICEDKKNHCLDVVRSTFSFERDSLFDRNTAVLKRLKSFVKQYKHKHYNTDDSLRSICYQSDKIAFKIYQDGLKRRFNQMAFSKLTEKDTKSFYDLLGFGFSKKLGFN